MLARLTFLASAWLMLSAAYAAGAAHAAPPACPEGQRWDASMSMCMPAPSAPDPLNGSQAPPSNAFMIDRMISPDGCGPGGYFHFGMSMCLNRPRALGTMSGMVLGSLFLADVGEQGPRGRHELAAPNWLMLDGGVDLARWDRLELDAMLTAELWTFPAGGYPELLQIGETDPSGRPIVDAQHPHSSPLMGLTLSDVISFSTTNLRVLRLSFSPRGESTAGPIAFMHRPTGMVNPDAPLGHHIGQDVTHISSTVFAASLSLGDTLVEASAFHGREPDPYQVDLPLGTPDSYAVRLAQRFGQQVTASASAAYVHDPEGDPGVPRVVSFSASAYTQHDLPRAWRAHTTLIFGGVTGYDHASFLASLTAETLFSDEANALWTRIEALQRTPAELQVTSADPDTGRWVGAATLGYTRRIVSLWALDFAVGGSGTLSFVPGEFAAAYGGATLVSGKLFLQARGMKMGGWEPH